MRFHPPEIPYTAELRWVLGRAFGPTAEAAPNSTAIPPPTGGTPVDLAERLGLASRIAARHPRRVLSEALGADASRLLVARAHSAAIGLMFERTAEQIRTVAENLELKAIFLKGFALALGGYVESGERPSGDLDLLVAEDRAEALFEALVDAGFRSSEVLPNAQHLPPLLTPEFSSVAGRRSGGSVDLHFRLRGVEVRSGQWATADELVADGLVDDLATGWSIPNRDLLLAHALTHGLEQHGDRPDSYPLLRLIVDIATLTPTGESPTSAVERVLPLCPAVEREEGRGAAELTETLARGALPAAGGTADLLLRHFLAGVLVEGYGSERRAAHLRGRLGDARRRGELVGHVRRKLWLNERELILRHGPPRHRWSFWGWRLRRPFDILWSLLRGGRQGQTAPPADCEKKTARADS
ncbi:MAG: nucleotidyltransferase family protein [Acidobacteriota bacterium]